MWINRGTILNQRKTIALLLSLLGDVIVGIAVLMLFFADKHSSPVLTMILMFVACLMGLLAFIMIMKR